MGKNKITKLEKILIVIPARGGSKGIPRKNLRLLNEKPLIYYSINNSLNIKYPCDVYVSSEDTEILSISSKFNAKIRKRPSNLSEDNTTLDPVIYDCMEFAENENKCKYDIIVTIQPTSPLLKLNSIEKALENLFIDTSIDTLISCINDTHLTWQKNKNVFVPNYSKRLNRQFLDPVFKETGGFLITRREVITKDTRIGEKVQLFLLNKNESIDIDSHEDWALCEYLLKRKHIVFVVRGNSEIGLGHVMNTLTIANDILNHEITFYCLKDSKLAFDVIKSKNYNVILEDKTPYWIDLININPSLVINDILNTKTSYIKFLKRNGIKVINFEDLGSGSKHCNILINAMYEKTNSINKQFSGYEYFIPKQEFFYQQKYSLKKNVKKVLISYGGVDPNNLTEKTLDSIYEYCIDRKIKIVVIIGMGYSFLSSLKKYKNISLHRNIKNISDYMINSDLAFTSGGRTSFELAIIGVPSIILYQNKRETTHSFTSNENGFITLGLGKYISKKKILASLKLIENDFPKRQEINKKFKSFNLLSGKKRIIELILKEIS